MARSLTDSCDFLLQTLINVFSNNFHLNQHNKSEQDVRWEMNHITTKLSHLLQASNTAIKVLTSLQKHVQVCLLGDSIV